MLKLKKGFSFVNFNAFTHNNPYILEDYRALIYFIMNQQSESETSKSTQAILMDKHFWHGISDIP